MKKYVKPYVLKNNLKLDLVLYDYVVVSCFQFLFDEYLSDFEFIF